MTELYGDGDGSVPFDVDGTGFAADPVKGVRG